MVLIDSRNSLSAKEEITDSLVFVQVPDMLALSYQLLAAGFSCPPKTGHVADGDS